jgi:hypothetical protein
MRDDNNIINNIKCVPMLTIALFIKKKKKKIKKEIQEIHRCRSKKSYKTWPIASIYWL